MKISKLIILPLLVCMMAMMTACQDTLPQRSTIVPSQTTDEEPVDETPVVRTRPSNDIRWRDDFCICKDKKALSYGSCTNVCSSKNTDGKEMLYANFQIGTKVELEGFGSVHGWCTVPLETDTANSKCVIRAKDEGGGVIDIDAIIAPKSNSVTANVSGLLSDDKTYVLTLVELESGAHSDSVQIVKFSEDFQGPILGPLMVNPITQFTCLIREYSTFENSTDIYYEKVYPMHFYFQPRTPPTPVIPGAINLICHDLFNPDYGENDNELFPRLNEIPGSFTLWDKTDPRFHDNNNNQIADVNDMIYQKVIHYGGSIPQGTQFFNLFPWAGPPELTNEAGNTSSPTNLGYYMAPWIDQSTYRSYCLTRDHYDLNNPLFRALGDVIQVDTEALYIGVRTGEAVNRDGEVHITPNDYILVRETDLKQVWFYKDVDGQLKSPTDENVANLAVFFHYPFNKDAPYIRSSNQRLYRVRASHELQDDRLSDDVSSENGGVTQYPPHDRRIGCIPKRP